MRLEPGPGRLGGFTLIEAVIAMSLTAVLSAVLAISLRGPITSYFDAIRRGELTEAADGALRRVSRDLESALPNSVRVTAASDGSQDWFMEFVPVVGGGRYRADYASDGSGLPLHFSPESSTGFDVLGPAVSIGQASDRVVVSNLGQDEASVYKGTNVGVPVQGSNLSTIQFQSATSLPFPSPENRFQIVDAPRSYQCHPGAGAAGYIRVWWGYGTQANQPASATSLSGLGGQSAVLVDNVVSCSFAYSSGVSQSIGVVSVRLSLSKAAGSGSDTVTLLQQVDVVNVP